MIAKIVLCGDYSPNSIVKNAGEPAFSAEICNLLRNSTLSFVNLECPLSDTPANRIPKQGPALLGAINNLNYIKELGFKGVTMANNHILDYGEKALEDTLKAVKEHGLYYVGAGKNIKDASQILYAEIEGGTIAIINCCEHEFSIAIDNHAGANPQDPVLLYGQILEAKKKADYVIVIIHGGVEHYQYPTPRMVRTYRFFVDAGADAVINHHQHCPCGFEEYKSAPIFYGLGNFFFPWDGKKDSIWNFGYMVKLSLEGNHKVEYDIIPYRQCDGNYEVNLLEGDDLQSFNKMMNQLNDSLQDEKELRRKLKEFNKANNYLYKKCSSHIPGA